MGVMKSSKLLSQGPRALPLLGSWAQNTKTDMQGAEKDIILPSEQWCYMQA